MNIETLRTLVYMLGPAHNTSRASELIDGDDGWQSRTLPLTQQAREGAYILWDVHNPVVKVSMGDGYLPTAGRARRVGKNTIDQLAEGGYIRTTHTHHNSAQRWIMTRKGYDRVKHLKVFRGRIVSRKTGKLVADRPDAHIKDLEESGFDRLFETRE